MSLESRQSPLGQVLMRGNLILLANQQQASHCGNITGEQRLTTPASDWLYPANNDLRIRKYAFFSTANEHTSEPSPKVDSPAPVIKQTSLR